MKNLFYSFILTLLFSSFFACSDDESTSEIISEGLSTVVFSGDITNEEAAKIVKNDIGRNTNTILVQNTRNLTRLNLEGLENAVEITVTKNEKLETISFPNLKEVYTNFSFNENNALKTVEIDNLNEANGISFFRLEMLETVSFTSLKFLNGRFTVNSCDKIKEIILPNLEGVVKNSISIRDNAELEKIEISKLEKIESGSIDIRDNSILKEVSVQNLKKIDGSLSLRDNVILETINFNSLSEIRALTISNTMISVMSFPELEYLSGSLAISSNEMLTEFLFPKLKSISFKDMPDIEVLASFSIINNPLITEINFPELDGFVRLGISNNKELAKIIFSKIKGYDRGDIRISGEKIVELDFGSVATFRNFRVSSEVQISMLNLSKATSFGTLEISNMIASQVDSLLDQLVTNIVSESVGRVILTGSTSDEALANEMLLEDKGLSVTLN